MAARPSRNGRELTRSDIIDAVSGVKDEVIVRIDASDRLTEEKFKGVRDSVSSLGTQLVGVRKDHQDLSAQVGEVKVSLAKMLGYGAGAGAVASLVITIVKMVLSH